MQGEYLGEDETAVISPLVGRSAVVEFKTRRFDKMAEAQAFLPFQLVQPDYLPEAYAFSHVNVIGEGDNASAQVHFTAPRENLLLSQRPTADQPVSIGLPEDYVIETVLVNGKPATWAEHVLLWEADGVSYLLSSPNLNQTVAIRIAESLK